MSGLLAVLIALVLVGTSATAVTLLLRPRGRIDALITGSVVAVADIVVAMLVLGVPGWLRTGPLLSVHLVQAVIPVALLVRRGRPLVGVRHRLPGLPLRQALWESALVGMAALALGWQLLVALVLAPYAYDALSYHLTNAASWIRAGQLVPSPLNLCCAYYPGNGDLLLAWPLLLLGSQALVGTVQVAAAALGGVAVAGIGRTAGLDRRGSVAAGALFVLTPVVLAQAPTGYVDIIQAALVLCGLHGLGRFAATARPSSLVVTALSTGLLAGTKGIGLLWAAVLGVSAVVLALVQVRQGRLNGRSAGLAVAGGLAACVLLGGWWYLRNAVGTGNPLYPFEVRVGGRAILQGPTSMAEELSSQLGVSDRAWPVAVAYSWAADLLPWRHGSYDYQQRSGGLGPLWSWLGVLVVPLVIGLWRRRSAALAALVPVFVVFLLQPWPWWSRFTLPLAAVGAIAVVGSVRWLRPRIVRMALQSVVVGLALLGALLVVVEVNPASRGQPLPMARVLDLVGAPQQDRSIGHLFFPEYRFLDRVPEQATVVVDLDADAVRWVYPLFGPRLQRTVVPAGTGPIPDSAWVVTSGGRPLDGLIARTRSGPVSDVRGVRVWAPKP